MEMDWESRVTGWAAARKLFSGSTASKQLEKLQEELGELEQAIDCENFDEVVDAIGDCAVVLCIIANMYGTSFKDCLESAWDQIKDRRGEMRNGIFVKESDL